MKRLLILFFSLESLLLIPIIGMLVLGDVTWSGVDFLIMGLMLFLLYVGITLVLQLGKQRNYRVILILFFNCFFLALWIELAVDVVDTIFAGT
jgi:hypothetical protein